MRRAKSFACLVIAGVGTRVLLGLDWVDIDGAYALEYVGGARFT